MPDYIIKTLIALAALFLFPIAAITSLYVCSRILNAIPTDERRKKFPDKPPSPSPPETKADVPEPRKEVKITIVKDEPKEDD